MRQQVQEEQFISFILFTLEVAPILDSIVYVLLFAAQAR